MNEWTVCRVETLRPNDVTLDPSSGATVRVVGLRTIEGMRPIALDVKYLVSHSTATLEFPKGRLMRRRWRDGENRDERQ